jgi:DHA1 family inner membrane transport protein
MSTTTHTFHRLLALANFAVGISAFVVIGLMSTLASEFALSKAQAGWMMTTYALVYAFSSPLLVALTGKRERAYVLLSGMALLAVGSLLTALAPHYGVILMARVCMALGAGLVTPVASAIAIASVPPTERGHALAKVFGGLTIAQAFGIPLGTWFGFTFGWRSTFAGIALLTALLTLFLGFKLPRGLAVQATSLRTLREALIRPYWLAAIAFTLLFMSSAFTIVTYFTPLLEARYGLTRNGITALLVIFGSGAIVGNMLGGAATDRIGAGKTLALLCGALILLTPLMTLFPLPLVLFTGVMAAWSIAGWSVHVPQQARLAALDPSKAPVLMALHAAALYLGNSLGAFVGGQVLERAGYEGLGLTSALLAALALFSLWVAACLRGRSVPITVSPSVPQGVVS